MADRTPPSKKKLVMIAVLAVILAAVVYRQATAPDNSAEVPVASTATIQPAAALSPGASPVQPRRRVNHDPVPLETTLSHNPFAYPEAFKKPEPIVAPADEASPLMRVARLAFPLATLQGELVAEAWKASEPTLRAMADVESDRESGHRQSVLDQWRATEMTAYYQSSGQPVALVGKRVLHEGEILDECVRVVEIRSDAVVYDVYVPAEAASVSK